MKGVERQCCCICCGHGRHAMLVGAAASAWYGCLDQRTRFATRTDKVHTAISHGHCLNGAGRNSEKFRGETGQQQSQAA